jgi:N-acyl-D-amino-acid deacylase
MSPAPIEIMIIKNACIIDGTGAPACSGSVVVKDGTIAAVGPLPQDALAAVPDAEAIDAGGKVVCPGFIDMHRHCDAAALKPGFGEIELAQGITTCMAGNCGMAMVPNTPETRQGLENYLQPCLGAFPPDFACTTHREYRDLLERTPLALNMGYFAGMGALKIAARGFGGGRMSRKEIDTAKGLLSDALDSGVRGMTLGLMYVPEIYCNAGELGAVAEAMKGRGVLCTHMRSETDKLYEAVQEVISIAKRGAVPLEISHFKAAGTLAWGSVLYRTIDLIERSRAEGVDVTVDFYPYDCGSSTMMQMLPPGYLAVGAEAAIAGLNKPENVARMRRLLLDGEPGWDNLSRTIGWDRTIISSVNLDEHQKWLGKSVTECVRESGAQDEAEFVADLMYTEQGKVAIINRSMSQDDIDAIARLPYSSLISDALYGDMKGPHPRLTGAFPHFLREYVLERKVLPIEAAIKKMTSQPAARLNLNDRGVLAPGKRADILVFDPREFRDTSTYLAPTGLAAGLAYAFIGGRKVVENGKVVAWDAGRVV